MTLSVAKGTRIIALLLVVLIILQLVMWGVIAFVCCYNSTVSTVQSRLAARLANGELALFASDEPYFNAIEQQVAGVPLEDKPAARIAAVRATLCESKNCGLYFGDIDYADENVSIWPAATHLARAGAIARESLQTTGDVSAQYRAIAISLLRHWLAMDYHNENWWQTQISVPWQLGDIAIMLKGALSAKDMRKVLDIVSRGVLSKQYSARHKSGANIMWYAGVTLRYAALTDDKFEKAFAIASVKRALNRDLTANVGEGVQGDGSFFQHGALPYTGGYGKSYAESVASVLPLITGTMAMPSEKAMHNIAALVLDGLQYISHGSSADYITLGRTVSRPDATSLAGLSDSLKMLLKIKEFPRKDALAGYISSLESGVPQDVGIKYFDDAKMLVSHCNGVYMSFKGGAKGLRYTESINGENLLGYNLSYGTNTTVMRTGNEYAGIAPLWDWSALPGTTAVAESDAELMLHKGYGERTLTGDFGGLVKDGAGVIYMHTSHEGISLKVACVMCTYGMVILGADVADSSGRALVTAIEQCNYAGSYVLNGESVTHNGIVYTNLCAGAHLNAGAEMRTGSYGRVNAGAGGATVCGEVFTASVSPTAAGLYAYSVQAESVADRQFVVIANNSDVQAVLLPDGRVAAVFYAKAQFEYGGKVYCGKKGQIYIAGMPQGDK